MSHITEFKNIEQSPNFPQLEEEVLSYWKEIDAFNQQLKKSEGRKPYTFYDGPPFATGLPHYGHICAGTIKDVITRYASMTGHHVPRKFGWDCHGLPVEFEIDKALKINTKTEREEFGLARYNAECRSIVMRYSEAWEKTVNRMGRWIDFKNDYKTLDPSFMESVWWVFKTIYDKGHVYRGCKIMPYSNACNTVLSNFEAGLNYKDDVLDPAIYINFPLVSDPEVAFLAWTTTPWTLPTNLALCVNPDFDYVKIKDVKTGKLYILAECRLYALYGLKPPVAEGDAKPKEAKKKDKKKKVNKNAKKDEGAEIAENEGAEEEEKEEALPFEIISKLKGKDLEGTEYTPLFDYYLERKEDGCFKVVCDKFVTSDAGTGIVHCAPAYGADDYEVCRRYNIVKPDDPAISVDDNGFFLDKVADYKGQYVKDADKQIIRDLKDKGRVFKIAQIRHSYPFCWRSNTPLIYKAVNQWFIGVTQFKDRLIANNKKSEWVPKPIQEGRFHNWLADANDWCFSRDRFWGNPIPLWISDDGEEVVCIGSIQELKDLSGVQDITDIHRESIDHITIPSKQGKGQLKRIPEVFDCWFESGAMPYASVGYPNKLSEEEFKKIFPADFIGEGLDQTRGWFYTLNVLATALFDETPYKNLIVNGLVLAEDGSKMSKSKKNYPDPQEVIDAYGADAIRLYLMNSPLVKADSLRFAKSGVYDVLKRVFLPWFNVQRFLLQNIQRWEEKNGQSWKFDEDLFKDIKNFDNTTDRWILASNQELIKLVRKELDAYRLSTVLDKKLVFLEELSNWYLKLNRGRLKGSLGDNDWNKSLNTLFYVLINSTILMAPYVPFIVESFYQNLRKCLKEGSTLAEESVHFLIIPDFNPALVDTNLVSTIDRTQRIIVCARNIRDKAKIPVKQGVKSAKIVCLDQKTLDDLKEVENYLIEEINVDTIEYSTDYKTFMKYKLEPNHKLLGEKFKTEYGPIRNQLMKLTDDEITSFISNKEIKVGEHIFGEDCFSLRAEFFPLKLENVDSSGQLDFCLVLDMNIDEGMIRKRFAREFVNRVQRLRQTANLAINDNIVVTFDFEDKSDSNQVYSAVKEHLDSVKDKLKKAVVEYDAKFKLNKVAETAADIDNHKVTIRISNNVLIPNVSQLEADFGEDAKLLITFVGDISVQELSSLDSLTVGLSGKTFTLLKGTHYHSLY